MIKSLSVNFKYLQIKAPNKYLVEQCIHTWPVNKLEKLYLKNVCDMKTRRFNSLKYCASTSNRASNLSNQAHTSYDIIEIEIIKLIKILFERNSNSLRVLGLKCVDPNIISSCLNDFGNLEILLLNNINDTDSVLQDLALVCKNLKCLELNKCGEFQGDGLQEIIDNCEKLETLQIGKQVFPTMTELLEINWNNLKTRLKHLAITTKFPSNLNSDHAHSSSSSSSSGSTCSSYSSKSSLSIDVYSRTIFNYLNESNTLEYLALEDFTLKFPDIADLNNIDLNSNLKYLYLRNIRNIKHLTQTQLNNLNSYLINQYNLVSLDLIGLHLESKFLCSVLDYLKNLKNFYFGHGKSYKKSWNSHKSMRHNLIYHSNDFQKANNLNQKLIINIDDINYKLAQNCPKLAKLGIFYRQSELDFKKDDLVEYKNEALIKLLNSCVYLKEISYLKSFKVQEEEEDDYKNDNDDNENDYEDEDDEEEANEDNGKRKFRKFKIKSYFHFIKYAIMHASQNSIHVNMKPCYGFDITPSSGHLLDINNYEFIQTSLPLITPPNNDFHTSLLNV